MQLWKRLILVVSGTLAVFLALFSGTVNCQSTLLEFPTPIAGNEISGTIKARDVGDPRLTTYYYWFEAGQGDVFVNLVTKNFAGDIDIFVQSGLKPLTKVVVYPDFGEVETGRVLYLRKQERLLLRVQGRSPNDDQASFRMKFAGSFIAAASSDDVLPEPPKVTDLAPSSIAVNSVGTIVGSIKKETENSKAAVQKVEPETSFKTPVQETSAVEKAETEKAEPEKVAPQNALVVLDELPKDEIPKSETKPVASARRTKNSRPVVKDVRPPAKKSEDERPKDTVTTVGSAAKPTAPEKKADPLADVRLVIVFKDGRRIERPLPEVFRFSVDAGVLTVVSKTGRVGRYQMIEVARVTIE